jgi:hypothetical protein
MELHLWKSWCSRYPPLSSAACCCSAYLASAGGESEMALWSSVLRANGVRFEVKNVGDFGGYGTSPNAYEVWVRPGDVTAARAALGFH